jgi:hypothetical protein
LGILTRSRALKVLLLGNRLFSGSLNALRKSLSLLVSVRKSATNSTRTTRHIPIKFDIAGIP